MSKSIRIFGPLQNVTYSDDFMYCLYWLNHFWGHHAVCMMSGFPWVRVIAVFCKNTHGLLHLIQTPDNQPFVHRMQVLQCHALNDARNSQAVFEDSWFIFFLTFLWLCRLEWKADRASTVAAYCRRNCDLEQDLWSRTLSKPNRSYHSIGEDVLVMGEKRSGK